MNSFRPLIYLSDDALSDKRSIRALFNHSNKLVTDRSLEPSVSTRDLEIGVADA